MDRILVTGANGFIGRRLCHNLQNQGAKVRVLLRQEEVGNWDDVFLGDLAEGLPRKLLKDIDTVFHLAGKAHALSELSSGNEYHQINVMGTEKLLEASQAHGVERFVFFSSVKAMGEGGELCLNECSDFPPETAYGRSKLEAENIVLHGGYVLKPVVLRLSMVYGENMKGNLNKMIAAIAKRRFPPLSELDNRRSMIHVADVVSAAIMVATRQESAGKVYILTDGQTYTTRQIYEWVCESLGRTPPSWFIPVFLLQILALMGDGYKVLRGRRFVIDSDSLQKLIGSACYSSKLIEQELGFKAKNNLQQSLDEIILAMGLK